MAEAAEGTALPTREHQALLRLPFGEVSDALRGKTVAHIKGFGQGMPSTYHCDALYAIQARLCDSLFMK